MDSRPARVRFAPSPTGHLHLGGARTALYNYLLAKRTGGKFILRIEDTDQKRYVPGTEQEIMDGLRWLGITYDEGPDVGGPNGPYRQTERMEIYREQAKHLVESGHAYPCFCSPERLEQMRQEQQKRKESPHYDGTCRRLSPDEATRRVSSGEKHVIRFKMPESGATIGRDLLRGDIVVDNSNVGDYVIVTSSGGPTYHLAAMVDDHLMGITHVIRGSEWLSTFPLHVNILRAFGWEEPVWVHLSVFLKPSGKGKMSKRDTAEAMKDGYSIFLKDMQELGYTPEGVLNWIVLMGWGVAEDDVMSLDQMVSRFDISHLTPSPAAINFAKLDHFNGTHIRLLTAEDLAGRLKPFLVKAGYDVDDNKLLRIVPIIRERLVTLDDCVQFAGWFFEKSVSPNPNDLIGKNLTAARSADVVKKVYAIISDLPDIKPATVEPPMRKLVEDEGLNPNQVFGIIRVAVTGQTVSPPLFESSDIVGKEEVLHRLEYAIQILEKME
jgi:glutamyl-tRNA synthetase